MPRICVAKKGTVMAKELIKLTDLAPEKQYNDDAQKPRWNRTIIVGVSSILIFVAGVGGWAASAPLGSSVIAPGEVKVISERQEVQHLYGGSIKNILVNDGDKVVAGQPLFTLDPIRERARYTIARNQYYTLIAERARYRAEESGLEILNFPDELNKVAKGNQDVAATLKNQRSIFMARNKTFKNRLSINDERIRQTRHEINALEEQKEAVEEQLNFILKELASVKTLYEKGLEKAPRLFALERQKAALQGQRGNYRALIARAHQKISEMELQNIELLQRRQEEAAIRIKEIEESVANLKEELVVNKDALDRTTIVAPRSGVVVDLNVHTEGEVVQPGRTLLTIIPQNEGFIIEAKISPSDIDNVSIGQEAKIMFKAFGRRTTKWIPGKVTSVSADKVADEGRVVRSNYIARIKFDQDAFDKHLEGHELVNGMEATAFISTGEKTLLAYLIEPISYSIATGMREP